MSALDDTPATASRHNPTGYIVLAIVALGVAVRVLAWLLIPAGESATHGDEISYYRAGLQLIFFGEQNLFWPPLTGWLVAGLGLVLQAESLRVFRFLWIFIDTASILLLWIVGYRVLRRSAQSERPLPFSFPHWVALVYALYLPAIGFAVHATSEAPALFLILLALVLVLDDKVTYWQVGLAGLLIGLSILARVNLLPLAFTLPAVTFFFWQYGRGHPASVTWKVISTGLFMLLSLMPAAAWTARNYFVTGYTFLTLNLVSNASHGVDPVNNQELNLVNPTVTKNQVERREEIDAYQDMLNGVLQAAEDAPSHAEQNRILREEMPYQHYDVGAVVAANTGTVASALDSRDLYLGRMTGRAARLVAPQTSLLDFVPRDWPLSHPIKLAIFAVGNLQWAIVLFGSVAGLLAARGLTLDVRLLLAAVVVGSGFASLFAVSEPRYAFPFTFALLIATAAFLSNWGENIRDFIRDRRALLLGLAIWLLLIWAWAAAALWALSPELRGNW